MQQGSDLLTTLDREVTEEVGLSLPGGLKLEGAYLSKHQILLDSGQQAGLLLVVYSGNAVIDGCTIQLSEEQSEYAWVTTDEAKIRLKHKYPASFIATL